MVGEVAVEIDAVPVAARFDGDAVGVEVGDHPEIGLCDVRVGDERAGERDPGGLVAVDASDDECSHAAVGVSQLNDVDSLALDRAGEHPHPVHVFLDGCRWRNGPRHRGAAAGRCAVRLTRYAASGRQQAQRPRRRSR